MSAGVVHYDTPAPEFGVWRLEPGDAELSLPGGDTGRILLVVDGTVVLLEARNSSSARASRPS